MAEKKQLEQAHYYQYFHHIALAHADDGYIVELGRIVVADTCANLAQRADIKEFYLGAAAHGNAPGAESTAAFGIRPHRRRKTWS